MIGEVKKCVDLRTKLLEEYFTMTDDMQNEVQTVISEITLLGDACSNATEIEEKFLSEGLSDRFNAVLPKCMPKSTKRTKEQRQQSRKIVKEMLRENQDELITDTLTHVANRSMNDLKDKAIADARKAMIKDGTMADYTVAEFFLQNWLADKRFRFFLHPIKILDDTMPKEAHSVWSQHSALHPTR